MPNINWFFYVLLLNMTWFLIGCQEGQHVPTKALIKTEENRASVNYFDTTFSDGTRFICSDTNSILSFILFNERKLVLSGNFDSLNRLNFDSFPPLNYTPSYFKNGNVCIDKRIYRRNGFIFFGYYYAPYNVCLYYINEQTKDFGKTYLLGKWLYPLIVDESNSMILIYDDFEKEDNPADGKLFLEVKKIKLENFPHFNNEALSITNANFNYDGLDSVKNVDSVLWYRMLQNPRIEKFIFSK